MNRIAEKNAFYENTRAIRTKFSPEEDQRLSVLVASYEDQNEEVDWSSIATIMKRTVRQCRERWKNYLNPSLSHEPWSNDEITLLIQLCTERGHNWQVIKQFFSHRSPNEIKNQWRRMSRKVKKIASTPLDRVNLQFPDFEVGQDQLDDMLDVFTSTESAASTGWHRYNSKDDQQLRDAILSNCTYDGAGRRITDWDRVSEITGRSVQSCKSRYQHYLKSRLDK